MRTCDSCQRMVRYLTKQHGFSFCEECKDEWEVVK